mgnify:CR=1 FL=1
MLSHKLVFSMEPEAAVSYALLSLRFVLSRVLGDERVVTSDEFNIRDPKGLRKLPSIPVLIRQLGNKDAKRLRDRGEVKRMLRNIVTLTPQTYGRFSSFVGRKDDRTAITLRMVIACVCIASQFDFDIHNLQNFIWYLFGIAMNEGTDRVTNAWKDVTNVLQNVGFENKVPGAPMAPKPENQEFMERLILCSRKFDLDLLKNCKGKEIEVCWTLSHLGQSRFLPPPSFRLAGEKVTDFITGLVKPRVIDPTGAFQLGNILGHKIKEMAKKQKKRLLTESHVSLSNGSCWEASRQELGKWSILTEGKAFNEYLNDRVLDRYDVIDGQYRDYFGNIICSEANGDHQIWRIAYLAEPLCGELGEQYNLEGTFEDMVFSRGFDARIGQLLHSWASWEYDSHDDSNLKAKLIIVTEPGGKIRPLTSGEVWAYVYMVPAMHMLKEAVECLPGARVGLNESDGLWRFGNSYERHFGDDPSNAPEYISSSDLTSATDRADHNVSRDLMHGMVTELTEFRTSLTDYLIEAVNLCCSPRQVTYKLKGQALRRLIGGLKQNGVEFSREGGSITFNSTTGVMMGDPITKVILTASSMGAYYATINGFDKLSDVTYEKYVKNTRAHTVKRGPRKGHTFGAGRKMFACAGDDHVMLGTLDQVLKPPRFLESMGFEISWEKYRISRRFVHYCQDFGLAPSLKPGVKIDNVKLRFLNQFQKMGSHGNFEFPDPLIGKAKGLERDFRFLEENWELENKEVLPTLKILIPAFLRAGMPSFFEERVFRDPIAYMPTNRGGLGIPNSYYEWMETQAEDIDLMQRTAYVLKTDPTMVDEKTKTWTRGIVFQQKYMDLGPLREGIVAAKEYRDVVRDTITSLDVGSTTPSSMRRVTKAVHQNYINLMMPNPLIGSKESVFSEIYSGRAQKQMVCRKRRSRQVLAAMRRVARENSGVILDIPKQDIDWNNIPGLWVSRTDIHNALGCSPFAPGLTLTRSYFEGRAGRYELDETLSQIGATSYYWESSQNSSTHQQ